MFIAKIAQGDTLFGNLFSRFYGQPGLSIDELLVRVASEGACAPNARINPPDDNANTDKLTMRGKLIPVGLNEMLGNIAKDKGLYQSNGYFLYHTSANASDI
jgi:hypothetical protein